VTDASRAKGIRSVAPLPSGQNFLNSDAARLTLEALDRGNGLGDLLPLLVMFRNQPRDRAAVSCDDEGFSPFHLVQQLRQMGFRFGSIYLAHGTFQPVDSTSRISSF